MRGTIHSTSASTSPTHKPLSSTMSAPAVQQPVPPRKPAKKQVHSQLQDDGLSEKVVLRRTAGVSSDVVQDDSVVGQAGARHYRARNKEADGEAGLRVIRRHSSFIGEADFEGIIDHITENGQDYAVIAPKKSTSNAPVDTLSAAKHRNPAENEPTPVDSSQSKHGDYILAYFPGDASSSKQPVKKSYSHSPVLDARRPKDASQTRFEYSQLSFGEEPKMQNKELAQELKKKKPLPPNLPPKYDGSAVVSPTVTEGHGLQVPIPKKRNLPHNKSDPEVSAGGATAGAHRALPRQQQSVPSLQGARSGGYENIQPVFSLPPARSGGYENVAPFYSQQSQQSPENGGSEQLQQLPKVPPR